MGRKLVAAMKDKLGKQLFEVVIQASANGDIIARETIKVTARMSSLRHACLLPLHEEGSRVFLCCFANIHHLVTMHKPLGTLVCPAIWPKHVGPSTAPRKLAVCCQWC